MNLISLLAVCIHICIEHENNILKILLYDYAKTKFTQKQLFLMYIKISSINMNTEFYKIMNKWIQNHSNSMIKNFLL